QERRTVKKEPQPTKAKEPTQAMTKKTTTTIPQKPSQTAAKESARTFAIEPVRPMGQQATMAPTKSGFHFSFKSPEGKKESVPVITQYYHQQIDYPYGKIDRHIDSRLMQAATIAQERAHAHSRSRCWP